MKASGGLLGDVDRMFMRQTGDEAEEKPTLKVPEFT